MTTPETRSSISPPTTPPDFELEQEIDLGRYWRALAWRWWLPLLAVVLGGVIGFAATSVARPYRSDVVLYLGQPLFPSGGQPIQTVSTNFQFVTQLITSTGLVREVAATVGVKPEQLRQATQIAAFTPEGPARQGTAAKIATISVVGFTPSRGKAA